ncbi:hypothetical protein BpHYR1_035325 [Brachionus plicatilis]|uniref:Uncharacterized protein n=1 Tax=Brachionus plicatilis TaxID=10195 RepID=A0A3M7PMA8_BRAPC|nr:hypothetical protein BpHYR1_035325 [Brachionus plicatilis]
MSETFEQKKKAFGEMRMLIKNLISDFHKYDLKQKKIDSKVELIAELVNGNKREGLIDSMEMKSNTNLLEDVIMKFLMKNDFVMINSDGFKILKVVDATRKINYLNSIRAITQSNIEFDNERKMKLSSNFDRTFMENISDLSESFYLKS